jgi:hypothetical protein
MREISLTQGKVAQVDDEDFEWLSQWKWHWSKGYARCCQYTGRRNGKETFTRLFMHRLLMNAPKGTAVDHIDGDGLNNQKANLRLATISENNMNMKQTKNKTGLKGVWFCAKTNRYQAKICKDEVVTNLGSYVTKEEAGIAYDNAALRMFGEYASPNYTNEEREKLLAKIGEPRKLRKFVGATSKYCGVSWLSKKNRWVVQGRHKRRSYYIGRFTDELEAARAFDRWAESMGLPLRNFPPSVN